MLNVPKSQQTPEFKILLSDEQEAAFQNHFYNLATEAIQQARDDAKLDRDFIDKKTACEWLGVSYRTLQGLIEQGLPCAIIGEKNFLISKVEAKKWILNYNKN